MRLLNLAGLATCLVVTLAAGAADAVSVRPLPSPPVGGPGSNVCVADCITLPEVPPLRIPGRIPRHRAAALQACGDHLAALRRVTVHQIARVDAGDTVHLVPLCDIKNHSLTQQEWTYLARGNVQGLIPAISRNDTLMAELDDEGYDANDVIGVQLAPNAAILYVSHR